MADRTAKPAANGGELVDWAAHGRDVWVAVRVGDAMAQAKARRGEAAAPAEAAPAR